MIRLNRRPHRANDANDAHTGSLEKASSAATGDEAETDVAKSANVSHCVEEVDPGVAEPEGKSLGASWQRVVICGLLPGVAMLMACGVGYLKWLQTGYHETQSARTESVQAAAESTIKILSYGPDSVDHDLNAASDRLTGAFRDAYTRLIHDVVIPGSKERKISSVATVPAATSISANPSRAVVMVFVNQSIVVGNDPPTSTASTVRVTVDKRDNHWLISDFTPI